MKRSTALSPLSHDHFEGLHLAQRIPTGLSRGEAPEGLAHEVVQVWHRHLAPHFQTEEALLVGPLEATGAETIARRLLSEHEALHGLVERVRTAPDDALSEFADLLRQHIRFEEREAFPHLERHLAAEALEALGQAIQARPASTAG